MADNKCGGGEPKSARLLALARAELLSEILPRLQGEHRYRVHLIGNAMLIALRELEADAAHSDEEMARELADLATPALAHSGLPPETSLGNALRLGALDGDPGFYEILVRLTERRRAAAG